MPPHICTEVKIKKRDAEVVTLSLGAGGRLSSEFVQTRIAPLFGGPTTLEDAAVLDAGGVALAFTTDSFVVDPLFFPGGDIGRLAVFGTVNDLAVSGAVPAWLSLGIVAGEGLSMASLTAVTKSIAVAAGEAEVRVVTGDTKVIDKASLNGLMLNTAGIGLMSPRADLSAIRIEAGDAVVVSGHIGAHEMAVLSERHNLGLSMITSDCGSVSKIAAGLINEFQSSVKWMRDPTRGGLATVLNELAAARGATIEIKEANIPIDDAVRDAAEILGLDPLYLACEGRVVAIVDRSAADAIVNYIRQTCGGVSASVIGEVTSVGSPEFRVELKTSFNNRRILRYLAADQQPRIC